MSDAEIRRHWSARLRVRKGLLESAEAALRKYSAWLKSARRRDAHPRGWLVTKVDELTDKVAHRREQVAYAERVLARHAPKARVRRPYERIVANVRNQSARGCQPNLIVLHSTESHNRPGNADLAAIVSWFQNPGAQASAHVVVDGEGRSARCVPDSRKAWACMAYNSRSLNIEQIGFAAQGRSAWTDEQLHKTAQYIAYWSTRYGIPIEHSRTRGVCCHSDLGMAGGGHHDPGAAYPLGTVLALARHYKQKGW